MKKIFYFMIFFSVFIGFASCGTAKVVDNRPVKEKVESGRFRFTANYVIPTSAGFQPRYLTSEYDLKITPDTITAYLPYFGRAYEASFDPNESGFKFTSVKFDYRMTPGRKPGSWNVYINILDQRREIHFTMMIWDNKKADLNVFDRTKQPIYFQGELE